MPKFQRRGNASNSRTIYINPLFNKRITQVHDAANAKISKRIATSTHINPSFLVAHRPPAIHMNPNFLKMTLQERQILQPIDAGGTHEAKNIDSSVQLLKESSVKTTLTQIPMSQSIPQKIISKSRTKIVREPAVEPKVFTSPQPAPLIRLSSKKLVRRIPGRTAVGVAKSELASTAASSSALGRYKLDRRCVVPVAPGIKTKRTSFVARYALQRSSTESKTLPRSSKTRSLPINKKLQLLNINGVLYRSTRNKLQRKDTSIAPIQSASTKTSEKNIKSNAIKIADLTHAKSTGGRVLFVHGTRFVLDKSGYKLTRMTPTSGTGPQKSCATAQRQRQRLDIGGLTYIASTTQNVFVRTRNHLALAHLNTAKTRSLQLLTRWLVKTNIPCPIFQRIGKCNAHKRGKCNKVHDKRQVTICPRFLRSECHNSNCLLSHNVSLSKMPVCKFYLQGVCLRTDCPYLHKKLSVSADLCPYFLRGYCKLAEQCNKRHEFVCLEYERSGNCGLMSCLPCKNRKRKLLSDKTTKAKEENPTTDIQETSAGTLRYFIDKHTRSTTDGVIETIDGDEDEYVKKIDSSSEAPVRPKVGALPAFIPLS